MTNLEQLKVLKSILDEEEYNKFMSVVASKQDVITRIITTPIDNYNCNLFATEEEKELLKYVYQNVRYYLRTNLTYKPKLEEGIAILFSKAAIIKSNKPNLFDNYFRIGDYSMRRELSNPFEEIARLVLSATKSEYFELGDLSGSDLTITTKKLDLEEEATKEIIAKSISKEGIRNITKNYCYEDIIGSIEEVLEDSNISSFNKKSATTKESRGVILDIIDKTTDLYYIKLDYVSFDSKRVSASVIERLAKQFDDKIVYLKRNIGIYEKTKRLIKESQS